MKVNQIKTINNQYPEIAKYILLAKNSKQGNIGQITSFIERDKNNKQKIVKWIEYWSKEYLEQAIILIKGLQYIEKEQKEELKQSIYKKIDEVTSINKKIYIKILASLYFEEFDKAEEEYMKIKKQKTEIEEQYKEFEKEWIEKQDKSINEEENEYMYKKTKFIAKIRKYDKILKNLNAGITYKFLNNSNYNLILRYVNIVQKCGDYEKIKYVVTMISKTINKNIQKNLIQEIVNTFIKREEINYAFDFLYHLKVKNYLEYIPKDKSEMEYIEVLNEINRNNPVLLEIQKNLFFNANYKKYNNLLLCTKKWIEYIEKRTEKLNDIEVVHEAILILKCIDSDINILKTNEYITWKIDEISNIILENKIDIEKVVYEIIEYYKILIGVINKIILNEKSFNDLSEKIEQLKCLNIFAYKEEYKDPLLKKYRKELSSNINISKKIYKEDMEKKYRTLKSGKRIYLYMNTHWKYVIPIEEFLEEMEQKNIKISYNNLNKYIFYGIIIPGKRNKRLKLKNVYNINRTRVRDPLKTLENKKYKCVVKIIGINRFSSELLVQISEIIEQDEYKKESKNEKIKNSFEQYIRALEKKDDTDIKELSKKLKKVNTNQTKKIAKTQILMMEQFGKEIIDILKKDEANPFKYKNIKSYKSGINSKKILKDKEKLNNLKQLIELCNSEYDEEIKNLKTYYSEYVKEKYKEILENDKNDIKDIVYYYMNTSTKYIINLNEYIYLIAITRFKEQENIDIYEIFKYYPILFKELTYNKEDKNYKVKDLENLQAQDVIYDGLKENTIIDGISYLNSYLNRYNVITKKIYINTLVKTYFITNSREYDELLKTLTNMLYVNSRAFNEIKKIKQIPELRNNNRKKIKAYPFLTLQLENICINLFMRLINDVKNLEKFILMLGNNNIFRQDMNINSQPKKYNKNTKEEIKETFLNQINSDNIETILYCYQNSYLKNMIRIEELIRRLFIYNNGLNNVDKNGKIYLNNYNLQINVKIKSIEQEIIIAERIKDYDDIKINIIGEISNKKNKQLKVVEYNTISKIFICKEIKSAYYNKNKKS